MTKGCHGKLRTPLGNRLLVALSTNLEDPELVECMDKLRTVPAMAGKTEAEMREFLEQLISRVPNKCPDCGGKSD